MRTDRVLCVLAFTGLAASSIAIGEDISEKADSTEPYTLHVFHKRQLAHEFVAEGAHFGDFDRDGFRDIVAGPYLYLGPEYDRRKEIYPPRVFEKRKYSDNFFAFPWDFNRDHWLDLVVIGFPGKSASLLENPKGQDGHWPRHVIVDAVDGESPEFSDITGDGQPELVFLREGRWGWARPPTGDPTAPWTFWPLSDKDAKRGAFTHGLGVGDLDGDGRVDVLDRSGWWRQPRDANREWTKHAVDFAPADGHGGAQMLVSDFDGDGDRDVVSSRSAHGYGLYFFEQTRSGDEIEFVPHVIIDPAKGGSPEANPYGAVFSQIHALALVDIDGDGVDDFVTGKRHGAGFSKRNKDPNAPAVIYWFRTTRLPGGGVEFVPWLIDAASGVGTQVVAGRVTSDALPDIVTSNKLGTFLFVHEAREVSRAEWEAARPRRREVHKTGKEAHTKDAKNANEEDGGKDGE